MTIGNTEKALLDFVLVTVGAGKFARMRATSTDHSPSFTCAVYNRQALDLVEQIQPYLRTYKAERAELILRDYLSLTPRNGKYTIQAQANGAVFEHVVLRIKPS